MPVTPEIQALLTAQSTDPAFARPGTDPLTIPEARELHDTDAAAFTPPNIRDQVGTMEEIDIPSRNGPLRGRLYHPEGERPTATLLWFHGGGWVTGSLDTADIAARALCARAGVTVATVEYALAPERPWPAAYEDGVDALRWASSSLPELGGSDVLLIGGDSAGGNVAATIALTHAHLLGGQVLIYPVIDLDRPQQDHPSRIANGAGYYVAWADIQWAIDRYIPEIAERRHPTASPSRSSQLADAPAAVIAAVEFDTLLDEDRAYAMQLRQAGVEVDFLEFSGLVHGAFDMLGLSPAADAAMSAVAQSLRSLVEMSDGDED